MKARDTDRTERRGIALAMDTFEDLGFAFREQSESDYGIDAHAELIESEQPTGRLLGIQIKSGDSYLSERTDAKIVFRIDSEHVDYWINHALPVVICLCDLSSKTIYWQPVTSETAVSTGKGYKILVPESSILGDSSMVLLKDLLSPLVSADRYTTFKTDDISHGLAKRYSFEVVINGNMSKSEIGAVIRQVTQEGIKEGYCRNLQTKARWENAEAHVVWVFIYLSAEDRSRHNHICRSMWIDEQLEESARPLSIDGENIGDDIFVEWNENYEFMAMHTATNTISKKQYLDAVLPLIDELKCLHRDIEQPLLQLDSGAIPVISFLATTVHIRQRLSEIDEQIGAMSLPPFECKEMDTRLECLAANMGNIALFFSEIGLEKWDEANRIRMAIRQHGAATEHFSELNYELKKVR